MRALVADYRARAREARGIGNVVRRLRVAASTGVRWLLEGYDDGDNVESLDAEVFGTAGVASRPTSQGEAIVVRVGGAANHPAVVATRDQSWAGRVGDLAAGETAIYNGAAIVRIKADGTIEIGRLAGAHQPTVLGTTYRGAEDLMLGAIAGLATALAAPAAAAIGSPAQTAATAAGTAISTFLGASASYLTTSVKVQ